MVPALVAEVPLDDQNILNTDVVGMGERGPQVVELQRVRAPGVLAQAHHLHADSRGRRKHLGVERESAAQGY